MMMKMRMKRMRRKKWREVVMLIEQKKAGWRQIRKLSAGSKEDDHFCY